MASHHQSLLDGGARTFGVSVDPPAAQAAMVEKLDLPFPMLSDPDRSRIIEPWRLADPKDPRGIARPALLLLSPGGDEVWRFVSRDFADRLPEAEVVSRVADQGWSPTTQDQPVLGPVEPGEQAMPLDALPAYFRGARFAALAMGFRHRGLGEAIAEDSTAYVAEMDRFIEAVGALLRRRGEG